MTALLEQSLQAIAIFSSSGPQALRKEAEAFWTGLFSQSCAVELAYNLVNISGDTVSGVSSDAIQFYGYSLLKEAVVHQWNGWTVEEHTRMKEVLLQLVRYGQQKAGASSSSRQKCAATLAQIAFRAWPQQWPTLLDDLFAATGSELPNFFGASAVYIGVLRELADELCDDAPSDLPIRRRREIAAELEKSIDSIMGHMQSILQKITSTDNTGASRSGSGCSVKESETIVRLSVALFRYAAATQRPLI